MVRRRYVLLLNSVAAILYRTIQNNISFTDANPVSAVVGGLSRPQPRKNSIASILYVRTDTCSDSIQFVSIHGIS